MNKLLSYTLTNKKIIKILHTSFYNSSGPDQERQKKAKPTSTQPEKGSDIFYPKYNDTLFWCFYILLEGRFAYDDASSNGFKEEKQFKLQFIDQMQKRKADLKAEKIRYLDVEDECVNQVKMGYVTLRALCLFHNINIYIVKNKTYMKFGKFYNETDKIYVFYVKENKREVSYGLKEEEAPEKIKYIEDNYVLLENGGKPLKAISNYSVGELKIMNQKMGISIYNENQKVKVKKDLYEQLVRSVF